MTDGRFDLLRDLFGRQQRQISDGEDRERDAELRSLVAGLRAAGFTREGVIQQRDGGVLERCELFVREVDGGPDGGRCVVVWSFHRKNRPPAFQAIGSEETLTRIRRLSEDAIADGRPADA